MKITKENYEVYFIDYFEGNLNRDEIDMLQKFLSLNPDLETEFNEFKNNFSYNEPEAGYKFKSQLKKQISDLGPVNTETIDEYSIAYLENDLNETDKNILLDEIKKNTGFKRIFDIYQLIKLQPNKNIKYKHKNQLKHFVIDRKLVFRAVGYVAAAAVLVLGIFIINPFNKNQQKNLQLAEKAGGKEVVIQPNYSSVNKNVPEKIEPVQKPIKINENKAEKVDLNKNEISTQLMSQIKKREQIQLEKLENKQIKSIDIIIDQKIAIASGSLNKIELAKNDNSTMEIENKDNKPETALNSINNLNLWTIAKLGLQAIGKLNEANFDLKQNYTSTGKLKSVSLITGQRTITAPVI